MSDEFDSGDDLFDNVDVDEMLQCNGAHVIKQQPPRPRISKHQKREPEDDHPSPPKRLKRDNSSSMNNEENVKLARRLLSEKFGYHSFRHEQEAAIDRVLAGLSALVVFPTGAGKSLCYQVSTMIDLPSYQCINFLVL